MKTLYRQPVLLWRISSLKTRNALSTDYMYIILNLASPLRTNKKKAHFSFFPFPIMYYISNIYIPWVKLGWGVALTTHPIKCRGQE
jgi:hypothetical protein